MGGCIRRCCGGGSSPPRSRAGAAARAQQGVEMQTRVETARLKNPGTASTAALTKPIPPRPQKAGTMQANGAASATGATAKAGMATGLSATAVAGSPAASIAPASSAPAARGGGGGGEGRGGGREAGGGVLANAVPQTGGFQSVEPPKQQASADAQAAAIIQPKSAPPAPAAPPEPVVIDSGNLEKDVIEWIEQVSGEKMGSQTFFEWCKDGQVLCRTANKVQPGICPRINKSSMPFQQMENVTAFIGACRKLGVLEKDVFSTVDLFEGKNLKSVHNCIFNLGSVVRRTAPTFSGPYLGKAQNAAVSDKAREKAVAAQSGGFRADISKEVADGVFKGRRM